MEIVGRLNPSVNSGMHFLEALLLRPMMDIVDTTTDSPFSGFKKNLIKYRLTTVHGPSLGVNSIQLRSSVPLSKSVLSICEFNIIRTTDPIKISIGRRFLLRGLRHPSNQNWGHGIRQSRSMLMNNRMLLWMLLYYQLTNARYDLFGRCTDVK